MVLVGRPVDLDAESVALCRSKGLDAVTGDVFDWLDAGRTIDDLRALVDATPDFREQVHRMQSRAGAAPRGRRPNQATRESRRASRPFRSQASRKTRREAGSG